MPSVIEARMKTTDARISLSPVRSPAKRGVQRIQMRSGIAAMRVSVMEFGRFTRWLNRGRRGGDCDYPLHRKARQRREGPFKFRLVRAFGFSSFDYSFCAAL